MAHTFGAAHLGFPCQIHTIPEEWNCLQAGYGTLEQHNHEKELSSLLEEFLDIFPVPTSLPLKREQDHHINLKHGTEPINVRPYRYPWPFRVPSDAFWPHQCSIYLPGSYAGGVCTRDWSCDIRGGSSY